MKKAEDFSSGRLLSKIIIFTIPLILTNLMQQMYAIIDQVIAGRFSGSMTLAAIGATSHVSSLLTNVVIGVSVGVSAVIAQMVGERDKHSVARSVHTSMALSIIFGLSVGIFGVLFSRDLLALIDTPADIINSSDSYMRIIFGGMIFPMIYNFGGAVLRAKGDTKRPLIILAISGAIKTSLTLFFVVGLNLSVRAIATATIISQAVSAILVFYCLLFEEAEYKLYIRKIKIHGAELKRILVMGIPIGIQSSMFSVSNVVIQSSINSFGAIAVAGSSAANNVNSLLYAVLNSMSHTSTIVCGQNFGAKKLNRVLSSLLLCCGLVISVGLVLGGLCFIFSKEIVGLFVNESEAIFYGMQITKVITITYWLNGLMETVSGGLRAINKSSYAMFNAVLGLCVVRIVWVYTYFASHRALDILYYSYPISWIVSLTLHTTMFVWFFKKLNNATVLAQEKLTT
ncbi:MAG: MATE family efflux transporter [Monoglobales bacterium]